jgi:hypothetical protein
VNLTADDLVAEDVDDQVEVEEHACDRPGHPDEYPMSSSYTANLRNRGKVEPRTTALTQGGSACSELVKLTSIAPSIQRNRVQNDNFQRATNDRIIAI